MNAQKTLTPRAWAELLLLALIWGAVFLSVRLALDEIGVLSTVAHRALWAALVLWSLVFALRLPLPKSGALIAALFLADEQLTKRKLTGVLIGFVGVATAIGLENLRNFDLRSLAQLAALAATFSYAFAGVWARKRLAGLHPLVAAAGMLTCTALVMVPLAWSFEGPLTLDLRPVTLLAIAYYALAATVLAYLLYYRVLAMAGSGNLMLVTLLMPPIAILLGWAVLGEALHPRAFIGFAVLTFGLAVLDGRPLAWLRNRV